MLQRSATNVCTAAAVFMTDDVRVARRLLGEKEVFRDLERRVTEAHFARIRAGRVESVETSALHLKMLRDLKRVNAHVASAACPVLEKMAITGYGCGDKGSERQSISQGHA
jgi:phosphate:Na+ symporter